MNKIPVHTSLLIASNNHGKINEVQAYADRFGITILSPSEVGLDIDVVEDGKTFAENAAKKVLAYLPYVDKDTYVIGDDSGLIIPALNNEPGVYTRRWAGYEMTDDEIVDYCLNKMKSFTGVDRKAIFKTVFALGRNDHETIYFEGELEGMITEQPDTRPIQEGLPFRNIFYITGANIMLYDIHELGVSVKTHREKALQKVFDYFS